ncbi:MAG TPA: hypothetical protein VFW33_21810 [Gemmataceae bacterium]|nr:hypothetical protein [Gemmataceae bacterium]
MPPDSLGLRQRVLADRGRGASPLAAASKAGVGQSRVRRLKRRRR